MRHRIVTGNIKVTVLCRHLSKIAIDKTLGDIDKKYWTRGGEGLRLGIANSARHSMDRRSSVSHLIDEYGSNGVAKLLDNQQTNLAFRKPPKRLTEVESLLTAEDVAKRLNVSIDWVWDHSSRKKPLLPVIRMGDGALRYRASGIEMFIDEQERMTAIRRRAV